MVTDADIDKALEAERLVQHERVLRGSMLGSGSIGVLLASALWSVSSPAAVLSWLAALAGALALRWAGVRAQSARSLAAEEYPRWALRHRVAFLLHGLAWVSVVLVPAQLQPGRELDLLVFAMSIVTAGALSTRPSICARPSSSRCPPLPRRCCWRCARRTRAPWPCRPWRRSTCASPPAPPAARSSWCATACACA
jgi:hypothetical protein